MATARFRHSNSPEEIAKREARPEGGVKDPVKGFRHYNHPEEVAKREASARGVGRPEIVLPSPSAAAVGVPPLPAGVDPVLPVARPPAGTALARLQLLEQTVRGLVGDVADLHASRDDGLEALLIQLFGSPEELQALRLMVQNFPAVQESQGELGNRLLALEKTWDAAFDVPPGTDVLPDEHSGIELADEAPATQPDASPAPLKES